MNNTLTVACPCPGTPHTEDIVTLYPAVTIPIGMAALEVFKAGGGRAVIMAGLAQVYLLFGIAAWSFVEEPDAKGNRRLAEITPDNVERFVPYGAGGLELAELADKLYSKAVLRPLELRSAKSSLPSQTEPSMPAIPGSGLPRQTRSRRSSPNGTAGKASEVLVP